MRINHEINNVLDLTAPLPMNDTLYRMPALGVIRGLCSIKCSLYILGKLVTTAIKECRILVTKKNISSKIIAHANWSSCDFQLRPTYDLVIKI